MTNYTFLLIGIIYATILPGFVMVETFLSDLAVWKKVPLYFTFSVLISTFTSYLTGLALGFNRASLVFDFAIFAVFFIILLLKKGKLIFPKIGDYLPQIFIGVIVYLLFFVCLIPAIFYLYKGYFVMSGPNWQDTAMHISIIESLTQGNFPPQAPYFSGQILSYYYFSDLHAAIINTLLGNFFPWVLVLINPLLAMVFAISIWAISFKVTKNKVAAGISSIISVLYGNLGFVNTLVSAIKQKANYFDLLVNNSYNFDGKYLQMTPVADYFLQNRPMMVGLVVFAAVILLVYEKKYLLAGIVAATLIKFQLFGLMACLIFISSNLFIRFLKKKDTLNSVVIKLFQFILPSLVLGVLFLTGKIGGRSMLTIFSDTFSWQPWEAHPPLWFLIFLFENLNLGFVVFVITLFSKKFWKKEMISTFLLSSIFLVSIPLVIKFTIYQFDMLKFYYYLIPMFAVMIGYVYTKIRVRSVKFFYIFFAMAVLCTSSVNMLIHSFSNRSMGYSQEDVKVGIWIRENTPQKSVFVTMPTVHCSPTDIGGRLRIISYINWPYSHGFNTGDDNVFSRVEDVTHVYETGDIGKVKVKYGANYVFWGGEESAKYPGSEELFEKNEGLTKVYDTGGIKIYEIL